MQECPGRLEIAKFKTAPEDTHEHEELQRHLETCAKCQDILNDLEQNSAKFHQNKERIWSGLEHKFDAIDSSSPRRSKTVQLVSIAGGLAAAAAVVLVFIWLAQTTPTTDVPESFRYKGGVTFSVYAERVGRQFQVEPDSRLMDGDEIRFVVTSEDPGYIAVFSVDSEGAVTPFYPDTPPLEDSAPWRLPSPGRHELPGGVTLDDVLGQEHYVVAYSPEIFERAGVMEKVKQLLQERRSLHKDEYLLEMKLKIRKLTVQKVPRR